MSDEQTTQEPVAEAPTEEVAEQPAETPEAVPAPVEKTPEQQFLDKYNALCEETGLYLSVEPRFIQDEDGAYKVGIVSGVVKKA